MSKVQTGARLPPDLVEEVRQFAQAKNMTISEVYANAVREYMARNPSQPSIETLARLVATYLADEEASGSQT